MALTRTRLVAAALSMAFGSATGGCSTHPSAAKDEVSRTIESSRRMPDGKQWLTENLRIDTTGSYCYGDSELNCRRYDRLYTWDAAQRGCRSLGAGWRLPTDDEWRSLATHYGGVREESADTGKASYKALMFGGSSGFDALLGGNREPGDGHYARLDAHGFSGPLQKRIRGVRGSTTSASARRHSIATLRATSRWRRRCGAPRNDRHPGRARSDGRELAARPIAAAIADVMVHRPRRADRSEIAGTPAAHPRDDADQADDDSDADNQQR